MDYHKINKTVMDDTQELCDKVAALKNAVASSIEREYILYGDDDVELGSVVPNEEMEIVVSRERTFEAAEKYRGRKICCLDFANSHSVGGGAGGIDVPHIDAVSLPVCGKERLL